MTLELLATEEIVEEVIVTPKKSAAWGGDAGVVVEEIRQGSDRAALFLIAGGDDGWDPYVVSVLEHVDADVPLYRLAIADHSPLRTVQGMATGLLDVIRGLQPPACPVQVVGFGLSAILAYEIGVRCVTLDAEVGFLGVVDIRSGANELGLAAGRLAQAANAYEIEAAPLDLHWFGCDRARESAMDRWGGALPRRNLHAWPLGTADAGLAESFGPLLVRAMSDFSLCEPGPSAELGYSSLMTIQSGRPGVMPYFCIPGAGASVVDFIPFSGVIGDQHPVHGLQARGMCGDLLPYGSVEAAAAVHVAEIERRYPHSAVHLVGHSFGGWIAYEVALRLCQRGRTVLSLTLLDSEAPLVSTKIGREYARPEALMLLVSLYEQAAGKPLGLCREDFEGGSMAEQLKLLHRQLLHVRLLPGASSPMHLRGPVRSFEAAVRTRYRPTAIFSGPTRLVLVRGRAESADSAAQRKQRIVEGWRLLAPNLELRLEAGNHVTMLKLPHIAEVARWMRNTPPAPKREVVPAFGTSGPARAEMLTGTLT